MARSRISLSEGNRSGIETKNRILDCCVQLFSQYGYEKTTFKKISDETGILPSVIAYHFKNKKDLYREAFYYFDKKAKHRFSEYLHILKVEDEVIITMMEIYFGDYFLLHNKQYRNFMQGSTDPDMFTAEEWKDTYLKAYERILKIEATPLTEININLWIASQIRFDKMLIEEGDRLLEKFTEEEMAIYTINIVRRFFEVDEEAFEQALRQTAEIARVTNWETMWDIIE